MRDDRREGQTGEDKRTDRSTRLGWIRSCTSSFFFDFISSIQREILYVLRSMILEQELISESGIYAYATYIHTRYQVVIQLLSIYIIKIKIHSSCEIEYFCRNSSFYIHHYIHVMPQYGYVFLFPCPCVDSFFFLTMILLTFIIFRVF